MAWILIVWLATGSGEATVAGRYETQRQCERAGEEMARTRPPGQIGYACQQERAR